MRILTAPTQSAMIGVLCRRNEIKVKRRAYCCSGQDYEAFGDALLIFLWSPKAALTEILSESTCEANRNFCLMKHFDRKCSKYAFHSETERFKDEICPADEKALTHVTIFESRKKRGRIEMICRLVCCFNRFNERPQLGQIIWGKTGWRGATRHHLCCSLWLTRCRRVTARWLFL